MTIHRPDSFLPLFQKHSPSSRAAAQHVAPSADTMRAAVLRVIRESPNGLTDIEIQERLHMNGSTQRPRRVELVERGLGTHSGAPSMRRPLTIDQLAAAVTLTTSVLLREMLDDMRTTERVRARRILVGLAREFTDLSYPDIAAWYGPGNSQRGHQIIPKVRSHSTIITQHQHHERLYGADPNYRDLYNRAAALVRHDKEQAA